MHAPLSKELLCSLLWLWVVEAQVGPIANAVLIPKWSVIKIVIALHNVNARCMARLSRWLRGVIVPQSITRVRSLFARIVGCQELGKVLAQQIVI